MHRIIKNITVFRKYSAHSPFSNSNLKLFSNCKSMSSQSEIKHGPVGTKLKAKLDAEFEPEYLDVLNESYMHNVPKGSESHFKLIIVSDKFNGLKLIERHRLVNELLKSELASEIHALSIMAKTSSEWDASNQTIHKSPPCRGGSQN